MDGLATVRRDARSVPAYDHADSVLAAEAELCALATELDRTHPGAAASLREGMAKTLTVLRLNVPPTLARTLRSTNAIDWRDGTMALRWCAAGMIEADKQFRRVNGHMGRWADSSPRFATVESRPRSGK